MDNQLVLQLVDQLESIYKQTEDDQKSKTWSTYEILIEEYNKIREAMQSRLTDLNIELPEIKNVPTSHRGAFSAGHPGAGTDAEKAKYSEILLKTRPLLQKLRALLQKDIRAEGSYVKLPKNSNRSIFIVHGKDMESTRRIKDYVANDLKYNPIILMDEANLGRTIPEKFEENAARCDYAIVLMTPDDQFALPDNKGILYRPRQNVILELGYFWAKFNRKNYSVIVKGEIDKPSDIQGVVYLRYKENIEEIFYQLGKEMKASLKD